MQVNVLVSIVAGAAVVCTDGWSDPGAFFDHCKTYRTTWYSAVPSMHLAIVHHAERVRMRTGELPYTCLELARNCSAALSPGVAARLETALECKVLPTYAMSECVPICSNPRYGDIKLGSVGLPAGPDVRILFSSAADADSDGTRRGTDEVVTAGTLTERPGQEGEVCVRGACCTAGYEFRDHMDPTFSAHVGAGWLRTGDKGYFDDDG
jgi:acyl-CoA synthetase (AMP-forming)/AMP-acid ligase II